MKRRNIVSLEKEVLSGRRVMRAKLPESSTDLYIARNFRPPPSLQLQSLLLNPIRPPQPPPPPVPTPPPPPNPPEPPNQVEKKQQKRREPKFRNWRKPTAPAGRVCPTANDSVVNHGAKAKASSPPPLYYLAPQEKLVITFPDPKITQQLVQSFSSSIDTVNFRQPVAPRQCVVKLHPGADVAAIITKLSKIPFGSGFIKAELFLERDPCSRAKTDLRSIIVGNLPLTTTQKDIKKIFPMAEKIVINPSARHKMTKNAIVHFATRAMALKAYRSNKKLVLENRNLTVRFYRKRNTEDRSTTQSSTMDQEELSVESDDPLVGTQNVLEDVEMPSIDVDNKLNIFDDAPELQESISQQSTQPYNREVSVKIEIEDSPSDILSLDTTITATIKADPDEKNLDDKLYEKLISALRGTEDPIEDGEVQEAEDTHDNVKGNQREVTDENTSTCTTNEHDILSNKKTCGKYKLQLELSSMLKNIRGNWDEQVDPDMDDLFNKLNPDNSDEEELNLFSV